VVGADDSIDVLLGQLTVHAVDQRAHLAGVDEQGLALREGTLQAPWPFYPSAVLPRVRNHRHTGIWVE
jgi:hypothetical protein